MSGISDQPGGSRSEYSEYSALRMYVSLAKSLRLSASSAASEIWRFTSTSAAWLAASAFDLPESRSLKLSMARISFVISSLLIKPV